MTDLDDFSRPQSNAEDSFFDLLAETLGALDRGARGQFLAHFLKSLAHVTLSERDSAVVWDRVLERQRALFDGANLPLSLRTIILDVLESMNILRVPIVIEYRELRKLELNAATDGLTGLYNRRLFEEYFEKELSRAKRSRQELALVILDLHRFKEVNDRYGHQQGDHALQLAATTAKDTVRASDYTFRIGGDEFAILLPNCDEARCAALSRRVRSGYEAAIKGLGFDVPLTLDFGIAVSPGDGEERESLVRLADRRLYEMKTAARFRDAGGEARDQRGFAEAPAAAAPRTPVAEPAEDTPDGGQEDGRDRRHWERVPLTGTSAHVVWQEGAMVAAPVLDVSFGGVAILVDDPDVFPAAFQGILHMPIQLPVPVSLRKTNQRPSNGKGTRMGCAFVTQA